MFQIYQNKRLLYKNTRPINVMKFHTMVYQTDTKVFHISRDHFSVDKVNNVTNIGKAPAYKRYTKRHRLCQKNMILYKWHPVVYTNRNLRVNKRVIKFKRQFLECTKSFSISSNAHLFLSPYFPHKSYTSNLPCP